MIEAVLFFIFLQNRIVAEDYFHMSVEEKRGAYLTAWTTTREERVISLLEETDINTLVIDVKDFSGKVFFDTLSHSFLRELSDRGIYLIARVTVFQDPLFALQRSDLAIKNKDGSLWEDRLGLYWIDPAARESWEYYAQIAQRSLDYGFHEVNFDYIRFPSDGDLSSAVYPFWDGKSRREVIKSFYAYLRSNVDGKISASLFGLTTVARNDLGIGQVLEDALPYFDYISPMVYPSHYASGFLGKENPALYPYEVVYYSLARARERGNGAKIRPWLQDFNMGAVYGKEEVYLQIKAVRDALGEDYEGYLLWNSINMYTR